MYSKGLNKEKLKCLNKKKKNCKRVYQWDLLKIRREEEEKITERVLWSRELSKHINVQDSPQNSLKTSAFQIVSIVYLVRQSTLSQPKPILAQLHEHEQNKWKITGCLFTSFLRFKAPSIPISCLVGSSLIVKCEHSKRNRK